MAARRHRRGRGQARRIEPRRPLPRPDPRRIGRALGVLMLLALVMGGSYFGALWVLNPDNLPVRSLVVLAPMEQVSREELRDAVTPQARQGVLYVDVHEVRAILEALPWVRRAEVRRTWPDMLTVEIEEFRAVARWADGGLVSEDGVRFDPGREWRGAQPLPLLRGPAGQEATMLDQYRRFARHLAASGLEIAELAMDERHAWWVTLRDGVTVALGRNAHELRLDRLVAVYRGILKANMAKVERLDLRYTNGFAVRWRDQPPAAGA